MGTAVSLIYRSTPEVNQTANATANATANSNETSWKLQDFRVLPWLNKLGPVIGATPSGIDYALELIVDFILILMFVWLLLVLIRKCNVMRLSNKQKKE